MNSAIGNPPCLRPSLTGSRVPCAAAAKPAEAQPSHSRTNTVSIPSRQGRRWAIEHRKLFRGGKWALILWPAYRPGRSLQQVGKVCFRQGWSGNVKELVFGVFLVKMCTMKLPCLRLAAVALLLVCCRLAAPAAPFAEKISFTQPDGTPIVLWGQGDEFYAVFETLDGYTVLFNPQTKAYDYAKVCRRRAAADFHRSGCGPGRSLGAGLEAARCASAPRRSKKQVAERFARWDEAMEVTQRWEELKADAAGRPTWRPRRPGRSRRRRRRLHDDGQEGGADAC